jgi:hypothetical protein
LRTLKLAYRDDDRTPVIFCIKEMARRHYDIDVEVLQIKPSKDYEAALLDGTSDVLIEHLEYLYAEAAQGKKITMFCAPSKGSDLELVVPRSVKSLDALKSKTLAVRTAGRPDAVLLWLKMVGLEKEVRTLLVSDDEVGRWGQWKKVISGECIATFMSPLHLPQALDAGLEVLAAPPIPIVGQFAQACLSRFARENPGLVEDYVKATIHALCLITLREEEALAIAAHEPMRRMGIKDPAELRRQFRHIAAGLKLKPYPTPAQITNTYEIATREFPKAKGINPLSLWNLHWVKKLDDEGFIDRLIQQMRR